MKKKLLISGMVAVMALGGVFYAYTWCCSTTEAQATTVSKDLKEGDCCKEKEGTAKEGTAKEGTAQTASMSMGCCEEKKDK